MNAAFNLEIRVPEPHTVTVSTCYSSNTLLPSILQRASCPLDRGFLKQFESRERCLQGPLLIQPRPTTSSVEIVFRVTVTVYQGCEDICRRTYLPHGSTATSANSQHARSAHCVTRQPTGCL
ncbi:uncharacterized protein LOC144059267 [Vanacampus margaritifer]